MFIVFVVAYHKTKFPDAPDGGGDGDGDGGWWNQLAVFIPA